MGIRSKQVKKLSIFYNAGGDMRATRRGYGATAFARFSAFQIRLYFAPLPPAAA
jgi:hypothetical protein